MSSQIDPHTANRNLADNYVVADLPSRVWTPVALPADTRVVESTTTGFVVCREQSDATLPAVAPAGDGSLLSANFGVGQDTTHLLLYALSADADQVLLNCYEA